MTSVSEVAHGIYQIETDEARVRGATGLPRSSLVYFIDTNPAALVEVGPTAAVPGVLDGIHQLGHDAAAVACIIITHVHLDHSGGAGAIVRQYPNVQIVVHERGARHMVDPTRLIEASRLAFGERFEDDYGPILPVPEKQVRAVADGETVSLGGRDLKVVYAPGHAAHQMCIYDPSSRGVFSGESLGNPDSTVVSPVAGFDPDAAIETIDRLGRLDPKVIFFSHGGVGRNAATHIQSVRANMIAQRDIIGAAMKGGEGREAIAVRLEAYQREHSPGELRPGTGQFDAAINWHAAFFKKKGLV